MSIIPDFELGLWNAWIFILPIIILSVIGSRILGKRGLGGFSGPTKKEKVLDIIGMVIIFAFYAYSIFLPLKLGTFWFSAGLLIYLLGAIIETIAMLNFVTTPVDKPVTKGVYRISRNPMYLGMFLIFGGTGIACVSWVFLLLTAVFIILFHIAVVSEERFCLQKYGNAYREYMNKIPRWIGIPSSRKNKREDQ
jgi:protein-S-isoprenylcysteine O-methyltransferase Ste14